MYRMDIAIEAQNEPFFIEDENGIYHPDNNEMISILKGIIERLESGLIGETNETNLIDSSGEPVGYIRDYR